MSDITVGAPSTTTPPPGANAGDGLPQGGSSSGSAWAVLAMIYLTQAIMGIQATAAQLGAKIAGTQTAIANSESEAIQKLIGTLPDPSDPNATNEINEVMSQVQATQTQYQSYLTPIQALTDGMQQLVSTLAQGLSFNFQNSASIINLWSNLAQSMIK